ncbi:unnamed protein product [Amoebophrya sp. A120]|nr:unnamed protein product [Amoebophrya sp. A120]|eukprot:GSA120T00007456001.1
MAVMSEVPRSPTPDENADEEPPRSPPPTDAPNGQANGNGGQPAFPSGYGADGLHDFEKINNELLGAEITLKVPHPEKGDSAFIQMHMGHDVARAKHLLAAQWGVPYSSLKLFIDGKLMMDPLSLCDIAAVRENEAMGMVEIKAELTS